MFLKLCPKHYVWYQNATVYNRVGGVAVLENCFLTAGGVLRDGQRVAHFFRETPQPPSAPASRAGPGTWDVRLPALLVRRVRTCAVHCTRFVLPSEVYTACLLTLV